MEPKNLPPVIDMEKLTDALLKARKEGRREVEWIRSHCNDVITVSEMQSLDCWNEKLKTWGIE